MAVVKAVSSGAGIGTAIDYVSKEEKTEEKLLSGIGCSPSTAANEMQATKELWHKTDGRQYKHFVHSFPKGEVTPEQAHEMAMDLCKDRFKGYEVLLATHKDKDHVHTHIIVNSVSYEDGHKLQWSKADLQNMKDRCNEISKEHGLSVPTKGKEITDWNLNKHKALEKAFAGDYKSYVLNIANTVADVRVKATSREHFTELMKDQGISTEWKDNHKNVTFKDKNDNKVRNTNLTKTFKVDFGKESLEDEFSRNAERERARKQLRLGADKGTNGADIGAELKDRESELVELETKQREQELASIGKERTNGRTGEPTIKKENQREERSYSGHER